LPLKKSHVVPGGGSSPVGSQSRTAREPKWPPFAPPAFDPHFLLSKLTRGKISHELLVDECAFSQGDRADSVFYLQRGKVKLTVTSSRGKEAVVAILGENSFFGEGCLAGQTVRISRACAVQTSRVIRIDKSEMLALLRQEPEVAQPFLAYILARNIRIESDLVDHLFNSSEKRLARLLLLMANFGQDSDPLPVIAKLSQETLAEMIGTTRSRVNVFLHRFRQLGLIDYDESGGMHVHSSLVSVVLQD
jgi:CRP/FNR family transcriptional regulator, cyclic AMP receptor protein